MLTDNNPLTYILTSAHLNATGHRWLAALSAYDFSIKYRAGDRNKNADALPHHPGFKQETIQSKTDLQEASAATVEAFCFVKSEFSCFI